PAPVDECTRAVGLDREGHGWNCLDRLPKFPLLLPQLPESKLKCGKNERESSHRAESAKQICLVIGRRNGEVQNRARRRSEDASFNKFCQRVLWSAMTCSICTGGGSLFNERWCGSTIWTPSPVTNQSLPSVDFATRGPYPLGAVERSLTPSAASNTLISIVRFGFAIHASTSVRAMRTRPQAVYNQSE